MKLSRTRIFLPLAFALILLHPAASQEWSLSFSLATDGALAGAGLAASLASNYALVVDEKSFERQDLSSLPAFDSFAVFPFNSVLDKASTIGVGLTAAWPGLFALSADKDEILPATAIYLEALSFTFAAKNALKYCFPRARPYAYLSDSLDAELLKEWNESLPSGHAALAFCSATCFALLQSRLHPESPATPWLIAGGYGLALGTSVLRVVSGNHFASDVVAGAALGSGIAYLVTALHFKSNDASSADSLSFRVAPGPALVLKLSL